MKTIEVVAAIIINNKKILATKRGYGEFIDFWEFPGGKTKPGEQKEEALKREIKEELEVDILVNEHLCTITYEYPNFNLLMHCFICTMINDNFTLVEHKEARWLKINELESVQWLPADVQILDIIKKWFLR